MRNAFDDRPDVRGSSDGRYVSTVRLSYDDRLLPLGAVVPLQHVLGAFGDHELTLVDDPSSTGP